MVRIIAPACPRCGSETEITGIHQEFDHVPKLDPIDINLTPVIVHMVCKECYMVVHKPVNEVKAPIRGPAV